MPDFVSDNPSTAVMDNPTQSEPTTPQTGTSTPGGQAQGGTPTADLFKGIDPNRLPPEVRSSYDQMLRDYRTKTEQLADRVKAETAKATEAYRQKAEYYDQFITQEEFVKQWNEYVQRIQAQTQTQTQEGELDPTTAKLQQKIAMLETEFMKNSAQDAVNGFASMVDEKGEPLHADFDKFNEIIVAESPNRDGSKRTISMLEVAIKNSAGATLQEKIANGYQSAKAVYDVIFEEGKKAGMGRLQNKMQFSTQPPSTTAPVSGQSRRPKNALEALQMAKAGMPVSK
jgi:hypothetical protein